MQIPQWLQGYLTEADVMKVEQAVTQVETQTSADIVVMLVAGSCPTGHVRPWLLTWAALLSALWIELAFLVLPGQWPMAGLGILLVFLTAYQLAGKPAVQRLFLPAADCQRMVHTRSQFEFYEHSFHRTRDQHAILIFVSLLERAAVVLADKGVAAQLPQRTWDEVCGEIIIKAKARDLGTGLVEAVGKCGAILKENFPRSPDDHSELSNRVIIKS